MKTRTPKPNLYGHPCPRKLALRLCLPALLTLAFAAFAALVWPDPVARLMALVCMGVWGLLSLGWITDFRAAWREAEQFKAIVESNQARSELARRTAAKILANKDGGAA